MRADRHAGGGAGVPVRAPRPRARRAGGGGGGLPENVARDWNGTDAVPNCSSGGRRLPASLASFTMPSTALHFSSMRSTRGRGGRNTATTTTTRRATTRRRVTRRCTRRRMRTPRPRSRRPTCPARPSSGRTSLADRRLPSPWTTRLPRAIDRRRWSRRELREGRRRRRRRRRFVLRDDAAEAVQPYRRCPAWCFLLRRQL